MDNKKLKIVGVIPSRMGSSRFPKKALTEILGMSMVGHVYHRSKMSKILDEVYILTPDKEITDYADSIGAKWVKDQKPVYRGCVNATSDAMLEVEKKIGSRIDIIVLIQGDEPLLKPEMIDMAIKPLLEDNSIGVVNLMAPIRSIEEHDDPNCIKVVTDRNGFALYFSREPIPTRKKVEDKKLSMFKQVCIMPFSREFLLKLNNLEPTQFEETELIDMIRVLEYGDKVKMVLEDFETYSVDVPDDLVRVEKIMVGDPLIKEYLFPANK